MNAATEYFVTCIAWELLSFNLLALLHAYANTWEFSTFKDFFTLKTRSVNDFHKLCYFVYCCYCQLSKWSEQVGGKAKRNSAKLACTVLHYAEIKELCLLFWNKIYSNSYCTAKLYAIVFFLFLFFVSSINIIFHINGGLLQYKME